MQVAENIVQRELTLGLLQVKAAIRQWNEEIFGARGVARKIYSKIFVRHVELRVPALNERHSI